MNEAKVDQVARLNRYADLIAKQSGRAVRPYRADGYVNMMTKYGTSKDSSERYSFAQEPTVPDDVLAITYEGNGLFARIIDTPAEEAIKHGFSLNDISDQELENFCSAALDELDWEENAMTAIKWARLFGGSIIVMLVNDGRGLEEPLDWKHIKSIDDIRVYDRSIITPDYNSVFSYDPRDPFGSRGSRLGMPEYYRVCSRYGNFTVHESRCLVFQNGVLPERTSNSVYQLWGMPEYVRIHRAMRDAEIAHGSATKMLDKSVQAVYKMKDLAMELATDEGESRVLKRLQVIDTARGILNSIAIDNDGEDYDFRTFQFSGVSDVIDTTCNFLSALTSIPQTILFGRSPAGMNSTGESDMENYYNYVQRIQKRMLRSNLRYLLSVIFQAGVSTGEIDEVPSINVEFNPLWSLSEAEEADLELKKVQTQQVKAAIASAYIQVQVLDPTEVRKKLADSEEFDIDTILDEEGDIDLMEGVPEEQEESSGKEAEPADDEQVGNSPEAAPEATKLPQDMAQEKPTEDSKEAKVNQDTTSYGSVGVLVLNDGKILVGIRNSESGYGLVCGPGGHIEPGETPIMAAARETYEEFGIIPNELISIGDGPVEPESGLKPALFLCTDYVGTPSTDDEEMTCPSFVSMEELEGLKPALFAPFSDGLEAFFKSIRDRIVPGDDIPAVEASERADGGPGSGNHNHAGRPGKVGGSAPSSESGSSGGGASSGGAYTSDEVSAVEYWKEGADGWGYANIKAIANGYEPPIVADARKQGNDSLAEHRMESLKETAAFFVSAVKKAPACNGEEAIRVTGSYGIPGVGKPVVGAEFTIPAFDPFSIAPKKNWDKMVERFGAEDQIVLRIKAPEYFKDISGIGKALTGSEHEVLPDKAAKYKIVGVKNENFGGRETVFGLSGGVNVQVVDIEPATGRSDGGPGSGNFGHEGRPGKVGGSSSSGAGGASSAWAESCDKACAEFKQMDESKQAITLVRNYGAKNGDPVYERIVDAFNDDKLGHEVDRWFSALKVNGDPTPEKPTVRKQKSLYDTVESEYGGDWEKARVDTIMKDTGFSHDEAVAAEKNLQVWQSNQWHKADQGALDRYVDKAPAFSGTIQRGMCFDGRGMGSYDDFMGAVKTGSIRMNGASSWTTSAEVARRYAHPNWDDTDSVIIKCVKNKTATPIEHLKSSNGGEDEVLAHSRTAWTVLNVTEIQKSGGGRHAEITVIEKGAYEDG